MSKLTLPPALQKVRRGYQKLNIPGILIGDILLILFFSIATDRFFTSYNLMLILRNCCTLLVFRLTTLHDLTAAHYGQSVVARHLHVLDLLLKVVVSV